MKYNSAFGSFSTDDLDSAEAFYGGMLGLEVSRNEFGLRLHLHGGSKVFVYPKADHQPATHTVLNFEVRDIDGIVDALVESGIEFERYDDGLMEADVRGVHRGDGMAIAWFRDPAGNFLSLIEE